MKKTLIETFHIGCERPDYEKNQRKIDSKLISFEKNSVAGLPRKSFTKKISNKKFPNLVDVFMAQYGE